MDHVRMMDGMVMLRSGQSDKQRQLLEFAKDQAADALNLVRHKDEQIQRLQDEIKGLKGNVRGYDGEINLLRYQLQKSKMNLHEAVAMASKAAIASSISVSDRSRQPSAIVFSSSSQLIGSPDRSVYQQQETVITSSSSSSSSSSPARCDRYQLHNNQSQIFEATGGGNQKLSPDRQAWLMHYRRSQDLFKEINTRHWPVGQAAQSPLAACASSDDLLNATQQSQSYQQLLGIGNVDEDSFDEHSVADPNEACDVSKLPWSFAAAVDAPNGNSISHKSLEYGNANHELKAQLEAQIRVNERLKQQIRVWVDAQLSFHSQLTIPSSLHSDATELLLAAASNDKNSDIKNQPSLACLSSPDQPMHWQHSVSTFGSDNSHLRLPATATSAGTSTTATVTATITEGCTTPNHPAVVCGQPPFEASSDDLVPTPANTNTNTNTNTITVAAAPPPTPHSARRSPKLFSQLFDGLAATSAVTESAMEAEILASPAIMLHVGHDPMSPADFTVTAAVTPSTENNVALRLLLGGAHSASSIGTNSGANSGTNGMSGSVWSSDLSKDYKEQAKDASSGALNYSSDATFAQSPSSLLPSASFQPQQQQQFTSDSLNGQMTTSVTSATGAVAQRQLQSRGECPVPSNSSSRSSPVMRMQPTLSPSTNTNDDLRCCDHSTYSPTSLSFFSQQQTTGNNSLNDSLNYGNNNKSRHAQLLAKIQAARSHLWTVQQQSGTQFTSDDKNQKNLTPQRKFGTVLSPNEFADRLNRTSVVIAGNAARKSPLAKPRTATTTATDAITSTKMVTGAGMLSPRAFKEQMETLRNENASIRDDIMKFRSGFKAIQSYDGLPDSSLMITGDHDLSNVL